MLTRCRFFTYLTFVSVLTISCDKNNDFVLLSIEDDKALGLQVSQEIAANPDQYPILSEEKYPFAYNYIRQMANTILNSGQVTYEDEFAWEVNIIYDDEVLNAFATPGGYIYVYTGLIKYLEKEDDLAGVLAHEIAHADQRHSIKQLQTQYGAQVLLGILLGNDPGQIEQIAAALAGNLAILRFSRDAEREADAYSVEYLSQTDYQCNAAYSFFQKLIDSEQAGNPPQFLSTHPAPEDRIEDINMKADEIGCDTTPLDPASYQQFQNSLPNGGQ